MFGARSGWFLALGVIAAAAAAGWGISFATRSDKNAPPSATESALTVQSRPTIAQLPSVLRWAWPLEKVMRRIDGAGVRLGGRSIQVDSETTLCSGVGAPVNRAGHRRWQTFDCTYTVFRRGIDRDLEFRVSVVGSKEYALERAHWVGEQR
jgi:hypothetical protein